MYFHFHRERELYSLSKYLACKLDKKLNICNYEALELTLGNSRYMYSEFIVHFLV